MKVTEVLTEAAPKKQILLDKKTIDKLHSECSSFFQNAKQPLYRGINRQFTDLTKIPIRKNRRLMDSTAVDTVAFNYLFEKHTGIPFIRNIAAFATGISHVADSYAAWGKASWIFPTDKTHYIRGENVKDLYADVFEDLDEDLDELVEKYTERMKYHEITTVEDAIYDVERQFRDSDGRLTVKQVDKLFGKYVKIWHTFVKQLDSAIDKYWHYDGYHPELNGAKEEISMFGAPFYYAFNYHNLIDKMYDLSRSGMDVYIGPTKLNRKAGHKTSAKHVFNAFLKGYEIYAVPRK